MPQKEQDTEQKIKDAAYKIFQEKGFAATKTRDIAEAANINVALLNYYFRSKKKLFDIVMFEALRVFFGGLIVVLNSEETSIREKVVLVVNHYMDVLEENQHLASFILNVVRESPEEYLSKVGFLEEAKHSFFVQQFREGVMKGEIPLINPIHFMLNLMGLTVFPFITQPLISAASGLSREVYIEMIQERRRLVPLWMDAMLSVK